MTSFEDESCIEIIVSQEDFEEFKRLDVFLTKKINHLSRNFIQQLFKKNLIHFKKETSLNQKLELKKLPKVNSIIQIQIPPPLPDKAIAEDIPLEVLFEDDHLIIINKSAGMVTHPAPGNWTGTLVNAVLHHCQDLQAIGDTKRPGIVHRLDKGTSGVMVVAKNKKCHEGLVLLFSTHDISRKYECLAMGVSQNKIGVLKSLIGRHPNNRIKMSSRPKSGRNAITHYHVLSFFDKLSHIELTLETGRTHQIRVHLSELLKSPILCDSLYGNPKQDLLRVPKELSVMINDYPHPFLHAKSLGFIHPITKEKLLFESPPPSLFTRCLNYLNQEEE